MQVRDLEDAVQELWRRRDQADCDLIASLRAATGLPTQEEIFSISPYSDDEESGPVIYQAFFLHHQFHTCLFPQISQLFCIFICFQMLFKGVQHSWKM
ncbi:hypothetical protein U1Q18_023067 [Sarracenia purpurea var. burkii]